MNLELTKLYDGKDFRLQGDTDNPLFCLPDVCEALELKNVSVAIQALPEEERAKRNLGGRYGETWFVTEPGLYRLIFRSNKPEAERFRKWVFSEVLPAIRKTGAYELPDQFLAEVSTLRQEVAKLKAPAPSRIPAGLNDTAHEVWNIVEYGFGKMGITQWRGNARDLLNLLSPRYRQGVSNVGYLDSGLRQMAAACPERVKATQLAQNPTSFVVTMEAMP